MNGQLIAAIAAFFIGLALLESQTWVGLALMAPLVLMGLAQMHRTRSAAPPPQPDQYAHACMETEQRVSHAEARAAQAVRKARRRAEADGDAALARATQRMAAEPRWR